MRTLRLTWSRIAGAAPLLVAATVIPAACGGTVETSSSGGGAGGTTSAGGHAGGTTSTGGTTTSSTGIGGLGGFGGSTMTSEVCPSFSQESTLTVDLPDPGVPAEPGQICAQNPPTVVSNTAARVTLTKYSQALNLAMGFVAIAAPLQGTVVGVPTIEVATAQASDLLGMVVTDVQATQGGFTFHAEWPQMLSLKAESWVQMVVKTTFQSQCGPGPDDVRTIESSTTVHLCFEEKTPGDKQLTWVSSGDECKVCDLVAEMAPSPIVPGGSADDLPLGAVLRLRVRPILRLGRKVLLLAENDGGPTAEYAWRATAGEVERLSPDLVLWTPPPGQDHLIQAIVTSERAAGVASYTAGAP